MIDIVHVNLYLIGILHGFPYPICMCYGLNDDSILLESSKTD